MFNRPPTHGNPDSPLANFNVQRASVSFWRSLTGSSGQNSAHSCLPSPPPSQPRCSSASVPLPASHRRSARPSADSRAPSTAGRSRRTRYRVHQRRPAAPGTHGSYGVGCRRAKVIARATQPTQPVADQILHARVADVVLRRHRRNPALAHTAFTPKARCSSRGSTPDRSEITSRSSIRRGRTPSSRHNW